MNNSQQQPNKTSSDPTRPPYSANLPNNNYNTSQTQTNKPKSLEGMNKSLLEALDLSWWIFVTDSISILLCFNCIYFFQTSFLIINQFIITNIITQKLFP